MHLLWFREISDAEEFQDNLKKEGIASTIRKADDQPPGWGPSPEEEGFDLWVAWADYERADKVVQAQAQNDLQNRMLCERCHENDATYHLTFIQKGGAAAIVRNLCEACHNAEYGAGYQSIGNNQRP